MTNEYRHTDGNRVVLGKKTSSLQAKRSFAKMKLIVRLKIILFTSKGNNSLLYKRSLSSLAIELSEIIFSGGR